MVEVGDVLAGKYQVEQVLGRGGMGYVVSALHTQLDQRVAVKFMVPELCQHPEAVARFLREARSAVRIRSEHVAKVLDVGTLDDGTPYMVMEFLWGRDLATEIEEQRRLPVVVAVDYVLQACEAIAEAHAQGIIHRDLKPANLFLTRRPDGSALVKVLDFGISKAVSDQASSDLTQSQSLIGSPHYMSPEQVRRPKSVDPRSDIWALGVILYELITGDYPFGGDTPMSVLASVVTDPAPLIREVVPALAGNGVEAVIARCLEKDPAKRYANIAEFAVALGPHASEAAYPLVNRIQGITRAKLQAQSGSSGAFSVPGSALGATPLGSTPLGTRERQANAVTDLATQAAPTPHAEARNRGTATDWGRTGLDQRLAAASRTKKLPWILGGAAVLASVAGALFVFGGGEAEKPVATAAAPEPLRVAPPAAPVPAVAELAQPKPSAQNQPQPVITPEPARSSVVTTAVATAAPRPTQANPGHRAKARVTAPPPKSVATSTPVSTPAPARPFDPLDERR